MNCLHRADLFKVYEICARAECNNSMLSIVGMIMLEGAALTSSTFLLPSENEIISTIGQVSFLLSFFMMDSSFPRLIEKFVNANLYFQDTEK